MASVKQFVLQATAATAPLKENQTATCDPEGKITVEAESTSEFSQKKSPASPKSPKGDPSEGGGGEKTQENPHFSPVEAASPLLPALERVDEAQKVSRSVKTAEMPTNFKPSEMQAWKRAHRL